MEERKIKAMFIFEMLGRPKEYLAETMAKFLETIASEKGISLLSKKIHDAKKVEQKNEENPDNKKVKLEHPEMFSTFSEVEIETGNIMILMAIAFKYMPAHIEIIYPEDFKMKNIELNGLVNDLLTRLHHYDSVAKAAMYNNQLLTKRFNDILKEKNKEIEKKADKKKSKVKKSKKKD